MILSIFIFILVFLLILFCTYRKRLHLFEIFFIWMTVWLITHSVSSILIVNFEMLSLSENQGDFWTHFFQRLLLYPLIIIIFFDVYLRIKNRIGKIVLLIFNICVISSFEFLFIFLGVLKNKKFTITDSLTEWTFTISLAFILWQWYRKKRLMRY
ncbi:hypothetical protein CWS01_07255 [Niallia nealsonii]|uniref:Uncharacterized protein n=1 Tax=Niallia nealsonii TaxID=115979 RepID=A0A2N0Z4H2_9BACI|nr:hypothetical protein CWS01_07255 [Niallia nealsonii]